MKEINYLDAIRTTTEHLSKGGVFLTVAGEKNNTMTIGWASVGYIFNRPIFTVMVRPQRHSYEMLKKAGEFTVSVPTINPLKQELAFAGTKSGADVDKFDGHGLTAVPAQLVSAPIVKECGLHFECRTVHIQALTPEHMAPEIHDFAFANEDYHVLFFGEILKCYTTDEA